MIYKIVIFTAITIAFLYLFKYYMEKIERFEDTGLSVNNIASNSIKASETPVEEEKEEQVEENKCDPGDWWDKQPIKAIRSKLWGASYNLNYATDGNIKSTVLIPINNPNASSPTGCLSVTKTGWHEVALCADKNINQRWEIKKISNKEDFETAVNTGKDQGTIGFTYGYKMDKVDYPFFIVVSKEYPSQALYYNGSALGVRPIGNYDDLKWDILPHEIKDPVVTNDFNYYSKLTPEMHASDPVQSSQLSGFQTLSNNPQALTALLESVMKKPNTNGAFGVTGPLKINVEMDNAMINKLSGDNESSVDLSANSVDTMVNNIASGNTVTEPFTNNNPYYPKKPMNIDVTLNYSMSPANQTSEQTKTSDDGTETVDINRIDNDGNLVKVGETKMNKKSGETKTTKCDDTKCHPDMTEWISKPYPCRACVPNNDAGELW